MWLAHAQQSPCFELHHTTQRCVSICIQWDCAVSAVWTFALEHFIHLNHAPKALWLVRVWCTAQCFGLDAVHFTESPDLKKGCQRSLSSVSSAALCDQSNVACRHQITQWLLDHVPALASKCSLVVPIFTVFSCLQHLAALQDMAGNLHKLHHPAGTSWDQSLGWSHVSKLIYRQKDVVAKHYSDVTCTYVACAVHWITGSGRLWRHQALDRGLHAWPLQYVQRSAGCKQIFIPLHQLCSRFQTNNMCKLVQESPRVLLWRLLLKNWMHACWNWNADYLLTSQKCIVWAGSHMWSRLHSIQWKILGICIHVYIQTWSHMPWSVLN